MALLDPFSLVHSESYKRSFKTEQAVIVSLAEAYLESAAWRTNFENGDSRRGVFAEASSNGGLRSRVRHCL